MEWISVEDRLPEVGQEVLVYRPLAGETSDPLVVIRKFSGLSRVSPQGFEHRFDCWCHPTHWMPLPGLPASIEPAAQ